LRLSDKYYQFFQWVEISIVASFLESVFNKKLLVTSTIQIKLQVTTPPDSLSFHVGFYLTIIDDFCI
jgi:hypothetical protein